MNIIFLGTPKIAVDVAKSLLNTKHKIVAVVSQEDKPVGRKKIVEATAMKVFAKENNIPCLQFSNINKQGVEVLKDLHADAMVSCAYGQILKEDVLNSTKLGVFNVHFSILPKYRGSSPVQWALINGEKYTGVTIMHSDTGLDTGNIIYQEKLEISNMDNCETLFSRLAKLAGEILPNTLNDIELNSFNEIPQEEKNMTYYPMLSKIDGEICFKESAESVHNLVRGLYLWPNAYAYLKRNNEYKIIKFFSTEVLENNFDGKIGEVIDVQKDYFLVKCGKGTLKVYEAQISGEKRLFSRDLINGKKIVKGDILLDGDTFK